jgi:hypothetical protein
MIPTNETTPPRPDGPKRPPSYSEEVDGGPKLLDEQPVDVEESHPAARRSSVQGGSRDAEQEPPLFEE